MSQTPKPEHFRLKALRKSLSLSQRELAREFGVTGSAIALWENGTNPIPGPALKLIELYESYVADDIADDHLKNDIRDLASTWTERIIRYFYGPRPKAVPTNLKKQLETGFIRMLEKQSAGDMLKYRIRRVTMERIIASIAQTKGIAMKIAQAATYIEPSLSVDFKAAIETLQLAHRPMAPTIAARVIYEEFGKAPHKLFAQWQPRPFATASIGHVHLAKLHSGESVAVKIQYPGVQKSIETDFKNLTILKSLALFLKKSNQEILKEIETAVLNECDYEKEAQSLEDIGKVFSNDPDIRIPHAHWSLSSKRVLTMDYLEGNRFKTFLATASGEARRRAARALWRFEVVSVKNGIMNSDAHESNFLFASDGSIKCLDFGRTIYWDKEHSAFQNQFTLAFALQDKEMARTAFKNMRWVKNWDEFDFDEFWEAVKIQQKHCIAGRPFRITPEYIQESMRTGKSFKGAKHLIIKTDLVFGMAQSLGLWHLLSELGVEEDWGQMTVDLLKAA